MMNSFSLTLSGSTLSALPFYMIALLDRAVLVIGPCFSLLHTLLACPFLLAGILGSAVWHWAGITCSQGVPLIFIHYTWMWDCLFCWPLPPCHLASSPTSLHHNTTTPLCPDSLSPPHLPVWMNIASLNSLLVVGLLYGSECFSGWFSGSSGCFSSLS